MSSLFSTLGVKLRAVYQPWFLTTGQLWSEDRSGPDRIGRMDQEVRHAIREDLVNQDSVLLKFVATDDKRAN